MSKHRPWWFKRNQNDSAKMVNMEMLLCAAYLLISGSYQFTLESENNFIFLSQLLQQGLLSAGILHSKQQDTMLHIAPDTADSSDLSKGGTIFPQKQYIEPKRMTTFNGVCVHVCVILWLYP